MDRRNALRVIGAAGAGLVLTACVRDGQDDDASTTTQAPPTSAAVGSTATTLASSGSTARSPSETGGPYPADGTQGASAPNVLDDSGIVRTDLTKSFGQYSGSTAGTPLTTKLTLVKAASGAPYAGAAVYLWHCDAKGLYSLYSQGATDQNFCRGVQAADSNGELTFKTVFPGAYQGRYPHFHYEVFSSLDDAKSAGSRLLTSQIALPEDACDEVYTDGSLYPNSARNMQQTSLQSDMVFADSYQNELATVSGSKSAGYTLNFTIVV